MTVYNFKWFNIPSDTVNNITMKATDNANFESTRCLLDVGLHIIAPFSIMSIEASMYAPHTLN